MVCFTLFCLLGLTTELVISADRFGLYHDRTKSKFQASTFVDGRRYRLSRQKDSTYANAVVQCNEEDSITAIIDSETVSNHLTGFVNDTIRQPGSEVRDVWIGLKLNDDQTGNGMWSDGTDFDRISSYSNWAPNEPQLLKNVVCIALWPKRGWKWDDAYCTGTVYYLCQDQDPYTYDSVQLKNLTNSVEKLASKSVATSTELDQLASKVDTLLDVNPNVIKASGVSTQNLLKDIEIATSNYNIEMGSYYKNTLNIAIRIEEITASSAFNDTDFRLNVTNVDIVSSVIFSHELIQEVLDKANRTLVQVTSVLYKKTSLFFLKDKSKVLDNKKFGEGEILGQKDVKLVSKVVSADIKNVILNNLTSPVEIRHLTSITSLRMLQQANHLEINPISNTSNPENHKSMIWKGTPESMIYTKQFYKTNSTVETFYLKCVFWDFEMNNGTGGWSSSGCHLTSVFIENEMVEAICLCYHLTNFALILESETFYKPVYLTYVTLVGCGVSIFGGATTILVNLSYKQLRKKLSQKMLINVCVGLLLLNGVFIFGIDRVNDETTCFVTTTLLHYAVLLSWCWMLVEGIYLHRTLTLEKVSAGNGNKFILISSLFCYVVPAVTVGTIATVFKERYRSERYCWLSGDILRYAIVYPVGVMLALNIILFITIMYSFTCGVPDFRKNINLKKIHQAFRRAVCMTFVMGLCWAFGYLMLLSRSDELKNAFSVLFTVFNAFQGLAILILYCMTNDNVRNVWLKSFCRYRATIFQRTSIFNISSQRSTSNGGQSERTTIRLRRIRKLSTARHTSIVRKRSSALSNNQNNESKQPSLELKRTRNLSLNANTSRIPELSPHNRFGKTGETSQRGECSKTTERTIPPVVPERPRTHFYPKRNQFEVTQEEKKLERRDWRKIKFEENNSEYFSIVVSTRSEISLAPDIGQTMPGKSDEPVCHRKKLEKIVVKKLSTQSQETSFMSNCDQYEEITKSGIWETKETCKPEDHKETVLIHQVQGASLSSSSEDISQVAMK